MRPMNEPPPQATEEQPTVLPYRRVTPPAVEARVLPMREVTLGLLIGLFAGAASLHRRDRLPGLLPGLSMGIAGGLLIVGVVAFYALRL